MPIIRTFKFDDFAQWLPLWDMNNMGIKNQALTSETWARLNDENSPVKGLCAVKNDEIIGILHYILHPVTGAIEPACYMQDVFTHPDHRGKGIARQLIDALTKLGHHEHWCRIYWLADKKNEPAQSLYKTIGTPIDFSVHMLPIKGS